MARVIEMSGNTHPLACSNDHRQLVIFSMRGLEIKCRTCKQVQLVSWQELETIRAALQSTAILATSVPRLKRARLQSRADLHQHCNSKLSNFDNLSMSVSQSRADLHQHCNPGTFAAACQAVSRGSLREVQLEHLLPDVLKEQIVSVALLLQRQHPLQPNVENFHFSQISQSHQVLHHHCDNRTNFVQLDIANSQSHQVLHHHCDFSIRIENLTFDHLTISPGPPPSLRRRYFCARMRSRLT